LNEDDESILKSVHEALNESQAEKNNSNAKEPNFSLKNNEEDFENANNLTVYSDETEEEAFS
jgi:hypothetical protein